MTCQSIEHCKWAIHFGKKRQNPYEDDLSYDALSYLFLIRPVKIFVFDVQISYDKLYICM